MSAAQMPNVPPPLPQCQGIPYSGFLTTTMNAARLQSSLATWNASFLAQEILTHMRT